jgi:hypothetical protein
MTHPLMALNSPRRSQASSPIRRQSRGGDDSRSWRALDRDTAMARVGTVLTDVGDLF